MLRRQIRPELTDIGMHRQPLPAAAHRRVATMKTVVRAVAQQRVRHRDYAFIQQHVFIQLRRKRRRLLLDIACVEVERGIGASQVGGQARQHLYTQRGDMVEGDNIDESHEPGLERPGYSEIAPPGLGE